MSMRKRCLIALIAVVGLVSAKNVWTGVYSADQAKRGLETYKQQCSMCHGETMSGGGGVPAVAGPEFLYSWNGKTAAELTDSCRAQRSGGRKGHANRQGLNGGESRGLSGNQSHHGDEKTSRSC